MSDVIKVYDYLKRCLFENYILPSQLEVINMFSEDFTKEEIVEQMNRFNADHQHMAGLIGLHKQVKEKYASIMRRTRKELGLTQKEMAFQLGISENTLSLYENGIFGASEKDFIHIFDDVVQELRRRKGA